MKSLKLKEKKILDKFKKDFPIGTYTKKDSYSIKILSHSVVEVGGSGKNEVLAKLQFSSNPNFGKSSWFNDLTTIKTMLKGYTLKK
jgi:hypothetical protein